MGTGPYSGGHLRHVGQALVQECHGSGSGNGATHEYGHLATSATWFAHNTLPERDHELLSRRSRPNTGPISTQGRTQDSVSSLARLDTNRESSLPIDDSGGSCDHELRCHGKALWRHEIDSIEIAEGDAITDNSEAYNLMRQRGVTNVIVMGVHLNLCVLGRPFSIRQMVAQGQNVVLMRDLTDCLHNTRRKPYVDHFTANDLMTWHIEKYWCPSITSDQIIGGRQFRFAADPNSAMRKGATVLTV